MDFSKLELSEAATITEEEQAQLTTVIPDKPCPECKNAMTYGDDMYLGMCFDCFDKEMDQYSRVPD